MIGSAPTKLPAVARPLAPEQFPNGEGPETDRCVRFFYTPVFNDPEHTLSLTGAVCSHEGRSGSGTPSGRAAGSELRLRAVVLGTAVCSMPSEPGRRDRRRNQRGPYMKKLSSGIFTLCCFTGFLLAGAGPGCSKDSAPNTQGSRNVDRPSSTDAPPANAVEDECEPNDSCTGAASCQGICGMHELGDRACMCTANALTCTACALNAEFRPLIQNATAFCPQGTDDDDPCPTKGDHLHRHLVQQRRRRPPRGLSVLAGPHPAGVGLQPEPQRLLRGHGSADAACSGARRWLGDSSPPPPPPPAADAAAAG